MRSISALTLFCVWYAAAAHGETVYFGSSYREVEVRDNAPTLLLLPAPPLSTACHPAKSFTMETLFEGSLSLIERTQLQVSSRREEDVSVHSRIRRMLKVRPASHADKARCTITLSSGSEVGIDFVVKQNLVRPFVELAPISDRLSRFSHGDSSPGLEVLRALVQGKPVELDEHEDYRKQKLTQTGSYHGARDFTTQTGRYVIDYAGISNALSAWKFEVRLKKSASYDEISLLKSRSDGLIWYSALTPEKDVYQKGDRVSLHVVAGRDANVREIARSLP